MNNYPAALDTVAGWIAAGAQLVPGETLFADPTLPEGPDQCATLYEAGGAWDITTNQMLINASLVARASSLADARKFIINCIAAALSGFAAATPERRGFVRDIRAYNVPVNHGRDDDGRVTLAVELTIDVEQTAAELEALDTDA